MTGANKNIVKLYHHITGGDASVIIQHIVLKGRVDEIDVRGLWSVGIPAGIDERIPLEVEGVLQFIYDLMKDAIPYLQERYACRKTLRRLERSCEEFLQSTMRIREAFVRLGEVMKKLKRRAVRVRAGIEPKHGRTRKKSRPTRLQRRQKRHLKKQGR